MFSGLLTLTTATSYFMGYPPKMIMIGSKYLFLHRYDKVLKLLFWISTWAKQVPLMILVVLRRWTAISKSADVQTCKAGGVLSDVLSTCCPERVYCCHCQALFVRHWNHSDRSSLFLCNQSQGVMAFFYYQSTRLTDPFGVLSNQVILLDLFHATLSVLVPVQIKLLNTVTENIY